MYPATLSRSLRMELGKESQFADFHALVMKLDKKPSSLIDFLLASFQSRAWSKKHECNRIHLAVSITDNLVTGCLPFDETIRRITHIFKYYVNFSGLLSVSDTDNLVTGCLPFDETIRRITHIFKYYVNFSGLLSVSDFIVKSNEGRSVFLSKIVLMRESPVLKDKFFKKRDLNFEHLKTFAPQLALIDELMILYSLLYTNDASKFLTLNTASFTRILFQCCEWQCKQVHELQKIFSYRIVDFSTASGELALSKFIGLKFLEELSRSFLSNLEMICYTSELTNHDNYLYLEPILDSALNSIFFPHELVELNRRLLSSGYEGSLKVDVHRMFMTFQDESTVAIGWLAQPETDSMKPIQQWLREKRHKKLNPERVKNLVSEGSMRLPDLCLIGMLIHFSNCDHLKLENYDEIQDNLFKILSVKNNLTSFSLQNYKGSLDAVLSFIAKHLSSVTSLEIISGSFCLSTLVQLLEKGNISNLKLIKCSLSTTNGPFNLESFDVFKKLKALTLVDVGISHEFLQIIFNGSMNLEDLAFDSHLGQIIVLPRSLKKLSAGTSLLRHYVQPGMISLFSGLPNLLSLVLKEDTADYIKNSLLTYFRARSHQISFEG